MTTLISILGGILILLALVHIIFPRYFSWKEDFAQVSLINRQVMEVHTFFVALTVALMGILCVTSADMLLESPLGRRICMGMAIFWAARLITQFFWYSPSLWKGKRFETLIHILFSILWASATALFSVAAIGS